MKQISFWAKQHVIAARIAIALIHVLLIIIAGYLAVHLGRLPTITLYIALAVLAIVFIVYPHKKRKLWFVYTLYSFKKTCDFIAAIGFFILVYWFASHHFQLPLNSSNNILAAVEKPANTKPTAQQVLESLKLRGKSTLTRKEKIILRKEFTRQLGIYATATLKQDKPAQASALAIILTIIAAIGLLVLLSALACNISCSGSGTLAIILLILGTAAIVLGAYAVINGSKKHRQKKMMNK